MAYKCFFEYLILELGFCCVAIRLLEVKDWSTFFFIGAIIFLLYWLYCLESRILDNKLKLEVQKYIRPCGSHGLWCSLLLPVALFVSCHKNTIHCSDFHFINSCLSISLMAFTFNWLRDLPTIRKKSYSLYCITTMTSFSIFLYNDYCVATSLSASVILHFAYYYSVQALLTLSPMSFTIGEAVTVAQAISVFCLSTWLNLIQHFVNVFEYEGESRAVVHVSQISLMGAGIFGLLLVYLPVFRKPLFFYVLAFAIAGIFIVPVLCHLLQQIPFLWFFYFMYSSSTRMLLVAFWGVATLTSVLIVSNKHAVSQKHLTIVRKYFHGIAVMIFAPGIFYDQHLMYLASSIIFGLFIIVECLRLLNMPPVGGHIGDAFSKFVDDKDQGQWILTHFYLLIGCSLPLWLIPEFSTDASIATFSGVLSVGIGDAVASVAGKKFGTNRWTGVDKTVEGTLSSVVVQSLICMVLWVTGTLKFNCWWMVLYIALSATLEAFTFQIDNLVLPLYLFILSSFS